MPLVIRAQARKKKTKYFRGEGFFDNLLSPLISTVTSKVVQDAAKEVAINVTKKAATELGNKASEKVINKIFPPAMKTDPQREVKLLAEQLFPRGGSLKSTIRRV